VDWNRAHRQLRLLSSISRYGITNCNYLIIYLSRSKMNRTRCLLPSSQPDAHWTTGLENRVSNTRICDPPPSGWGGWPHTGGDIGLKQMGNTFLPPVTTDRLAYRLRRFLQGFTANIVQMSPFIENLFFAYNPIGYIRSGKTVTTKYWVKYCHFLWNNFHVSG
jgi:hypothetical protein